MTLSLVFFPKLLQGPIERGRDLLPQLASRVAVDPDRARQALVRFTWGLFKKLVVADRLGALVDPVYADGSAYGGLAIALATYAFALQIYLDFSGYTDMALGAASLLGIELSPNFDRPYLATSMAEFWRRWHISFSRWILDYVFRPLQLWWRQAGSYGTAAALLVAFLVSGLWHGATWGFLVWGGLHGLLLAASVLWRPHQKRFSRAMGIGDSRLFRALRVALTIHLVCLAWVFFRAASVQEAVVLLRQAVTEDFLVGSERVLQVLTGSRIAWYNSATLAAGLTVLAVTAMVRDRVLLWSRPPWFRWSVYVSLVLGTLLFQGDGAAGFLYVRF